MFLQACLQQRLDYADGRAVAGDASDGLWWLDDAGQIVGRAPVPGGVADLQLTGAGGLLVRTGSGQALLLREPGR